MTPDAATARRPAGPGHQPGPFRQFDDAGSGKGPATVNGTPEAVLAMADQLDQAGSTAAAHRLYARVAPTIAEHWPPDRIASGGPRTSATWVGATHLAESTPFVSVGPAGLHSAS
jgi:hypothetical protein